MGTDYKLIQAGEQSVELWEMSNKFTLAVDGGDQGPTFMVKQPLTVEDLLKVAAELIKVASYFEPDAGELARMLLAGSPDDYTRSTLRDVASAVLGRAPT